MILALSLAGREEPRKPIGSQTKSARKHHWTLLCRAILFLQFAPRSSCSSTIPTPPSICSAGPSNTTSQHLVVRLDYLYPAYIRGLACPELGDGRSAAGEFQKLIDKPGLCRASITGPLARLQLGRAQRLMGITHPPASPSKNSLAFGKVPTVIFPSIDKPKPSTPSSKNIGNQTR
jgi:hypothetical protein